MEGNGFKGMMEGRKEGWMDGWIMPYNPFEPPMNEHGFCSRKKPLLDNITKKGSGVRAMMGLGSSL
jgi:hypothetical protein